MNFKNYVLNEANKERTEFGCVMLGSTDIKDWEDKHLSIIEEDDLYTDEEDYGLCDLAHVTLLWGIHEDEIDQEILENFISSIPITEVTLENISIFENDKFDVVKYEVVSDDIHKYRAIIENVLPNTQTFPDFNPHMTLAYVDKGKGKKYVKNFTDKEKKTIVLNESIYSDHTYKKKKFNLDKLELNE